MPRVQVEEFGSGNTRWLGSDHGIHNARSGVLTLASFVKATHYPDGYIRSGTPVNAADESNIGPWTGAAGEELGFVLFDRPVEFKDGTAPEKINAPILRHGLIKLALLPITTAEPTTGASGFTFVGGAA